MRFLSLINQKNFLKIENGIVVGNVYNKYDSKNPIFKIFMRGFLNAISDLLTGFEGLDVHEVGCGEGYLSTYLHQMGMTVRGSDISSQMIFFAQNRIRHLGLDIPFKVQSVYDLRSEEDSASIIFCCEVLEHIPDPREALKTLRGLTQKYALFSVPNEPLWRILNICRMKYLSKGGNTPGHCNHWSTKKFIKFVEQEFEVVKILTPLPWTILLAK